MTGAPEPPVSPYIAEALLRIATGVRVRHNGRHFTVLQPLSFGILGTIDVMDETGARLCYLDACNGSCFLALRGLNARP